MLTALPDSISSLRSLKVLEVELCSELCSWPEGEAPNTFRLALFCVLPDRLPDSFGRLSSLTWMDLDFGSKRLPDSFCNLTSLRQLKMGCAALTSLPDRFGSLKSLQQLTVKNSDWMQSMSDSFRSRSSLQ